MKLKILNTDNKETGSVELPKQFSEEIREDLVKRAVLAIQSHKRQPYGSNKDAGKRHSTEVSKRRRDYRGSYGHGISRVPRKVLSRRGTRMNWVGAEAPGTVGGRRAHYPKAEKIWDQKINDKERKKAIRSALAAVMAKDIVAQRGHVLPDVYPFIIDNDFEKLKKTKDIVGALKKIGLEKELERATKKKVRAGKGKTRGRKYRRKSGILLVVNDNCELIKAANNIPGTSIIKIKDINTELLAPGTDLGRISLFTKGAIENIKKNNLFT